MKRVQPALKRETRGKAGRRGMVGKERAGDCKEGRQRGQIVGAGEGAARCRGGQQRHQRHALGCGGTFETDAQRKETAKRWMFPARIEEMGGVGPKKFVEGELGRGRRFHGSRPRLGSQELPGLSLIFTHSFCHILGVWGFVCLDYSFWGPSGVCEDTN